LDKAQPLAYSAIARQFHWWTVGVIAAQVPLGLAMTVRGGRLGIWDTLTNTLYSAHKLLGVIAFCLVAARLCYRALHGAPPSEPGLASWQRIMGHLTHWGIYALLLATPALGYLGVQLYPALDVFGVFSLPALMAPNNAASTWVLQLHGILAVTLIVLVAGHVAAAMFHYFIRRDGVVTRMLPRIRPPRR
jgi:cytochrome b561